jgi:hypothetical protein
LCENLLEFDLLLVVFVRPLFAAPLCDVCAPAIIACRVHCWFAALLVCWFGFV